MKKNMLVCLACCGLLYSHVSAQSVGPSIVASAGGGGAIGGQSFDFAFGEMTLVNTLSAANIVVTQGVLQPHPPPANVAILNASGKAIAVYPNPASETVTIAPKFDTRAELAVVVYDVAGRKMLTDQFGYAGGSEVYKLNLRSLAAGQYMLVVDLLADGETTKYGFTITVLK